MFFLALYKNLLHYNLVFVNNVALWWRTTLSALCAKIA